MEAKGKTVGLNIGPLSNSSQPVDHSISELEFHYFFMRKFWFAYLAKALVVFPGGFGTMDELFEILTLVPTQEAREEYHHHSLRLRILEGDCELRRPGVKYGTHCRRRSGIVPFRRPRPRLPWRFAGIPSAGMPKCRKQEIPAHFRKRQATDYPKR